MPLFDGSRLPEAGLSGSTIIPLQAKEMAGCFRRHPEAPPGLAGRSATHLHQSTGARGRLPPVANSACKWPKTSQNYRPSRVDPHQPMQARDIFIDADHGRETPQHASQCQQLSGQFAFAH